MEILFYHLQQSTLEQALPALLEKTLQKGWKAVIRASSEERLKSLDDLLWTFRDDSFLPHGMEEASSESHAPVVLTLSERRINNAEVIFIVDGADLPEEQTWTRAVLMFDGNDEEALNKARLAWKALKAANREATYWRQDAQGRWEKAA